MPHGPDPRKQKIDVALLASRLPEPLRKPAGFVGGMIENLVGAGQPESLMPGPASVKLPAKVPPLPKGPDAVAEILNQLSKLHHGRGRSILPGAIDGPSDMERLEELMPDYKIPESFDFRPRGGQVVSKDDYLKGLVSDGTLEPSATTTLHRAEGNPTVQQWLREFLGTSGEVSVPVDPLSRGLNAPHKIVKGPKGPPDLSQQALEQLLRFLAD